MVIGVIDIGTNTTRLLVAEVAGRRLRPVLQRRHFVSPDPDATEDAPFFDLVSSEIELARRRGASEILVAGTSALRAKPIAAGLTRVCDRLGAGELRVLSEREEAELAFRGATLAEGPELRGRVMVADVGGGSTELAAGLAGAHPDWWASRPLGSRTLTERELRSDPPSRAELQAARGLASSQLANLESPGCETALAVAGGMGSLRRLCGPQLDPAAIGDALDALLAAPSPKAGRELELAPQRVRLLPAALLIFEAIGELVGRPLRIASGGVREGLALSRASELAQAG